MTDLFGGHTFLTQTIILLIIGNQQNLISNDEGMLIANIMFLIVNLG